VEDVKDVKGASNMPAPQHQGSRIAPLLRNLGWQ